MCVAIISGVSKVVMASSPLSHNTYNRIMGLRLIQETAGPHYRLIGYYTHPKKSLKAIFGICNTVFCHNKESDAVLNFKTGPTFNS